MPVKEVHHIQTSAVIIGAGPAGAGVSFFLSKYGIPHVVIEKSVFPRDKVCGDAVSGKSVLVINRANPEWLDEIFSDTAHYLPSWGIVFVAPNCKPLEVPFKMNKDNAERAPGFTAPRLRFDEFLFRKMRSSYCTVFQAAEVKEVVRIGNEVSVQFIQDGQVYEVVAPVIIGADGDKSIVRKKFVGTDNDNRSYSVGLRAYYTGVEGLHHNNFIELHFLKDILPGYFWIFPLPGGIVNVGVGLLSEEIRKKKINLRELMLHIIATHPAIAPRFANATLVDKIQGWGLPMAMEQVLLSGDNYMLTGDAASLIDPFSGEGIGNALYSGMLAAAAIKEALEQHDFSAMFLKRAYDDVVNKRLGSEFAISATLQRLCKYPWLFNLVVNKAYKSESLRNTISSMFTDMDLRSKLTSPSFYLKILMNK